MLLARRVFVARFCFCFSYLRTLPAVAGTATLVNAWDKILHHMERRVNPHSFTTWFRPTRQQGAENGTLVVRVPNRHVPQEAYGNLRRASASRPDGSRHGDMPRRVRLRTSRNTPPAPVAAVTQQAARWTSTPSIISSIRATRSIRSSSATRISSRTRLRSPSPSSPRSPTTRFISTAAWAWARLT